MSRIIDADSHFMEPLDLWERYIEPKYRSRCLRFEREPDGNYALLLDGEWGLRLPARRRFYPAGGQGAQGAREIVSGVSGQGTG